MSINKVILIGNLGSDPEVRYLEQDRVVANVSLATSESYTDKQGNKVTQTEWHKLELWDQLAKIAEKYLTKGKQVYVEGKIKTDQWTDKDGNNKTTVRIRVNQLQMLGNRESEKSNQDSPEQSKPETVIPPELNDDGLPF
jgi:single-strand DNA-binding protein